jgi:hypothetical protein
MAMSLSPPYISSYGISWHQVSYSIQLSMREITLNYVPHVVHYKQYTQSLLPPCTVLRMGVYTSHLGATIFLQIAFKYHEPVL